MHGVRTLVGHGRAGEERGSGVFVVHDVEGPGDILPKRAFDVTSGRCASEWASPGCRDGEVVNVSDPRGARPRVSRKERCGLRVNAGRE